MYTIQSEGLSRTESGTLVTEASSIGLPPGQWPTQIKVQDGELYNRWRVMDHHGEFSGYEYRTHVGYILRVYND